MSILGTLGSMLLPAAGVGLRSLVSNTIGNVGNYMFQAREAQKNRDFQDQMQQNQHDFQTQMFEKTNEWNSAKAQAQRYREAGFNPYLMMSSGANAGTAVSQPGAGASGGSSPFGGFQTNPADYRRNEIALMDALTNQRVGDSQAAANAASARSANADASLKEIRATKEEAYLNYLLEGMKHDNQGKKIANEYQPKLYDASIRNSDQQLRNMAQEERGRKIANAIASKELQGFDAVFKLKVAQMAADIRDKIASEGLKLEQAQKVWYDGLHELEKIFGTKLDNEKKEAIFESEVVRAYRDAYGSNGLVDYLSRGIHGGTGIIIDKTRGRYKGKR